MLKKENKFSWFLCFAICELLIILIPVIFDRSFNMKKDGALYLFYILQGFFFLAMGIIQAKQRSKLDTRRIQALQNAEAPLAEKQPEPDPVALTLPARIRYRPKMDIAILLLCVFTFLFFVIGIIFLAVSHGAGRIEALWICTGFALILALIWAATLYYYRHQWFEVTETGLTFHRPLYTRTILWQDARLFAIIPRLNYYNTNNARTPDNITLELSSARVLIQWRYPHTSDSYAFKLEDFKEYQLQMQQLSQVIAARTHLPLYDLR